MSVIVLEGYSEGFQVKNLWQSPQDFSASVWSKIGASVTANAAVAPDGTTTAGLFNPTNGTFNSLLQNATVGAGRTYTISYYAKAVTTSYCQITLQLRFTNVTAGFFLSGSGSTVVGAGGTSSIESVGSGWYRCSITATATSSGTEQCLINTAVSLSSTRQNGTGDIYLWQAQFEEAASPSSYTSDYPTKHARILWADTPGTFTATSEAEGFDAENAQLVGTNSWWKPSINGQTLTNTFTDPALIDCIGIAAHDLSGATVTLEYNYLSVWTEITNFVPTDNSPIMVLFPGRQVTGVRVTVSSTNRIGRFMAGQALTMIRPGYTTLGQIDLKREVSIRSYVTEGGQFLGKFIERRGLAANYQWNHLPEDWYRANFDAFAVAAQTDPFFIAARPDGYETDVAYAWVDEVIMPERMGMKNWLSVGFNARGHVDA